MNDIRRINPGPRMSQAVIHNGIVWLAGQVGDPARDITGQTETCLTAVDMALAAAGTDKSRMLTAQIWLADMADFDAMNAVWEAWVPAGQPPARATGEAKLATPDYRVEVIVTAAL